MTCESLTSFKILRFLCNLFLIYTFFPIYAFLLCGRPLIVVNISCNEHLTDGDIANLRIVADLAVSTKIQLVFMGEFLYRDNVQLLKGYEPLLDEELVTTVDTNAKGLSNILCPGSIGKSSFNGHSGAIKSGLSHLAIPRGWSWGGPASPFCPIWTEIKVPD